MCQHCKARRSCIQALEQDLASKRPGRQDGIAKIEEVRKHINGVGKPFAERLDLVKCHHIFGIQDIEPADVNDVERVALSDVELLLSNGKLGSCYRSEEGKLDMSLQTDSMKRYVLRDLRIKSLPGWIAKLDTPLHIIDVSGNPNLSRLPVDELCSMTPSLKAVNCEYCVRLPLPPPEIALQGGEASLRYLQRVQKDSEPNKRINLILIGNGESGKTSMLKALRSRDDKAGKIDVDNRTIGIDLHEWKPDDADGLTFDVLDFGGQHVYAKTNQYFIVRRALYVLVWNVMLQSDMKNKTKGREKLKAMISSWLRATQARVPGASVLLVATHIDLATASEVKEQCAEVNLCVQKELKKMLEEDDENILPLDVIHQGWSFMVDCLKGDGIKVLRESLCKAAKQLLWWNEIIPRPYLRLREAVVTRSTSTSYLKTEEYLSMLREAHVNQKEWKLVTSFLHDMGVLKYFGHHFDDEDEYDEDDDDEVDVDNDNEVVDDDGGQDRNEDEEKYSVEETVFIHPAWMIDVFRGVMRHDWQHLLEFFKDKPAMLKKTKKLLHLGIIDEDMFPYLWPQKDEDFWGIGSKTANLGFTCSHVSTGEAIALLRGCDLAHFLGADRELLCPGIIPSFMHQHKRAVPDSKFLCAHMTCKYNIFPAGFIDRLVVLCAARHFDVDCSGSMAVMKGWGRTLVLRWIEDEDQHTLIADASTKKQIKNLKEDLKRLQAFFPGMRRREREEENIGEEIAQVGIFAYGDESVRCARDIQIEIKRTHDRRKPPVDLVSVVYESDSDMRSIQTPARHLVNILCISTECEREGGHNFLKVWNDMTHSKAIIIPVLLEDYRSGIKDFQKWWPGQVSKMERYKVFFEYKADTTSIARLYRDIISKLQQGQSSYEGLLSATGQNELLCEDCLHSGGLSLDSKMEEQGNLKQQKEESAVLELSELKMVLHEENLIKKEFMTKTIKCERGHIRPMSEVLHFNSSFSPCPICISKKGVPFFFSRPVCLSKLARDLTAKIFCLKCQKEVDVLDVTPPQVFLSYNWGHKDSTQEMVRQVKREIEEKTSLQCWFDVEGGINVGEDHVQKMEIGVSRCEVFVLFISDKYVKSANCRREYRSACETNKYIIPVFVPLIFDAKSDSKELESESGWKGDKHEGWWKKIDSSQGNATGIPVDWNHLNSFPKTFDLRAQRHGDRIEVSGLEELVAAVQARAYRGATVFHEVILVMDQPLMFSCVISLVFGLRGDVDLTCIKQVENSFLGKLSQQKELLDGILSRIQGLQARLVKT